MFIVTSTVTVPPGKSEEVIDIYRNRSHRVDQADGFQSFRLLQNMKKPEELTVQLEWSSKAAYLAWARSDEFKEIHDMEKNYPDQELAGIVPTVRQYEVVTE